MRWIFFTVLLSITSFGICQPAKYTVANAHSHNDYEQDEPLMKAWRAGFGSIEADIFLHDNNLLVAHEEKELDSSRTLQHLYLDPLNKIVSGNGGYPYTDHQKNLILLIDIKTAAVPTLKQLIGVLQAYPALTNAHNLQLVISGNRPFENAFSAYPKYIFFDGLLSKTYDQQALQRIAIMSANLAYYTKWKGKTSIGGNDRKKLLAVIDHMHSLQKPVRFWNSPDFEKGWRQLMKLGVDYLNTDHIEELQKFLEHSNGKPHKAKKD
jgi:alkaline phosphatase